MPPCARLFCLTCPPNLVTHTAAAALDATSQGEWPAALQVFGAMRARGGALRPNAATFNALILAFAEAGHGEAVRC